MDRKTWKAMLSEAMIKTFAQFSDYFLGLDKHGVKNSIYMGIKALSACNMKEACTVIILGITSYNSLRN